MRHLLLFCTLAACAGPAPYAVRDTADDTIMEIAPSREACEAILASIEYADDFYCSEVK